MADLTPDIIAGHHITYLFRDHGTNKPSGSKLIFHRDGDRVTLESRTPYWEGGGHFSSILGSDSCNNFVKFLEAVHAFLTLDVPTLDEIAEKDRKVPEVGV